MRCPKCQYISFDNGDRCRNCGYDFSLTVDTPAVELPIQDGTEALGPLSDFALHDPDAPDGGTGDAPVDAVTAPAPAPNTGSLELPLFKGPADPDAPLVTPGNTPRTPLSVRRHAPALPKPRPPRAVRRAPDSGRRAPVADEPRLALDTAEMPVVPEADERDAPSAPPLAEEPGDVAPPGARLLAGIIDLAIIGGIDAAVLYFTLRMCGLGFAEVRLLPVAPFVTFLLILNGGYCAIFVAAAGQTIGKMAAGLRVVPGDPVAPPTERVSFGHALIRAGAYVVSALPAGLGFLPAFFGRDGRALHDRLADTRVVRA